MITYTKKDFYMWLLVFCVVFQEILTQFGIAFMPLFDELLTLGVVVYCFIKFRRWKLNKNERFFCLALFFYYLIGWYCSIKYEIQPTVIAFQSSLLSIKFFILYFVLAQYLKKKKRKTDWLNNLYNVRFSMTILLSTFVFFSTITNATVFMAAWDLCAKSVFLVAITLSKWQNSTKDYTVISLCMLLLLSTGRSKAFGIIGIILLVGILVLKKGRKIKIPYLLVIILFAVLLGWNKINYYFVVGNEEFARSLLFYTGFRIASDFFPFGLGWGSFASYFSGIEYSKVYYMYGLNKHGELGESARLFLTDTYWPSVLGETGWLGAACIIFMIVMMYVAIQKSYQFDKKVYAAGMVCFLYMMITTVEESGFMQPVLMCLALLMALFVNYNDRDMSSYKDNRIKNVNRE